MAGVLNTVKERATTLGGERVRSAMQAVRERVGGNAQAQANKQVARRWAEHLWNRGNFAVTPKLVTADFVSHGAGPDRATEEVRGYAGHDAWIRTARTAVPDFHVAYEDLIAEGDRVVGRWTVRGTLAATGEPIMTTGIHIYRIVEGKIAEMWVESHRVQ